MISTGMWIQRCYCLFVRSSEKNIVWKWKKNVKNHETGKSSEIAKRTGGGSCGSSSLDSELRTQKRLIICGPRPCTFNPRALDFLLIFLHSSRKPYYMEVKMCINFTWQYTFISNFLQCCVRGDSCQGVTQGFLFLF